MHRICVTRAPVGTPGLVCGHASAYVEFSQQSGIAASSPRTRVDKLRLALMQASYAARESLPRRRLEGVICICDRVVSTEATMRPRLKDTRFDEPAEPMLCRGRVPAILEVHRFDDVLLGGPYVGRDPVPKFGAVLLPQADHLRPTGVVTAMVVEDSKGVAVAAFDELSSSHKGCQVMP